MNATADPQQTLEAFKHQCAVRSVAPPFSIAVSGGRDSMALVLLAAAAFPNDREKILALTVDHGLRSESADEARRVGQWCKALGIPHRTLLWGGDKPRAGLQDAARNARYQLLIQSALDNNIGTLLTAHSADDQAETVFMRLRRGAGLEGLAAMRPTSKIAAGPGPAITLARPLLGISRARLTAYCKAHSQEFIDDPSNDDPTFERVRVRALLAALGEQNLLTGEALQRSADHLQRARQAGRDMENALFQTLQGCFYATGAASLDRISTAPGADGLYRRLLFAVSGAAYPPNARDAVDAVKTAWEKGAAALSGALIRKWRERLWFTREPAALLGRAGVAPMDEAKFLPSGRAYWDNRFIIELTGQRAANLEKLRVRPLGPQKSSRRPRASQNPAAPEEADQAAPGIFLENQLVASPAPFHNGDPNIRIRSLTQERFQGEIIRF